MGEAVGKKNVGRSSRRRRHFSFERVSISVRGSFGNGGSPERRLMNEALARLGQGDAKDIRRGSGRLIFALDLTGSREHSLHHARIATAAMFDTIKALGAVAVKLVYYRGSDECRATQFHSDPDILSQSMGRLSCETGETQIARVLRLALAEQEAIAGVVFVGDHCEDDPGELRELASALGKKSRKLFVFHECADHDERSLKAKPIFKDMAEASGGIYVEFKPDSGVVLREMLSNIGALAAAGPEGVRRAALPKTPEARQLKNSLLLLADGNPGCFDILRPDGK
jgi:hypothetical protein